MNKMDALGGDADRALWGNKDFEGGSEKLDLLNLETIR